MATKRPAHFIDEDNYDSDSSSDDPSPSLLPPSKKQRVVEEPSPAVADDVQLSEPFATPSMPQTPTSDERDEIDEEQLETQTTSTQNVTAEITNDNSTAASGAYIVEDAAISEKNPGDEPAADGEAEEAKEDNEDHEEVEDREFLLGPSHDDEGKKSVSEELPWIREALKAAGLDADGNELPPEPEFDY